MARILVIDDDRLIRTLLASIFEMHGIECVGAAGGKDGLRHLAAGGFDLVLLDLLMPDLDGFQVLERAAVLPPPRPPIVVATAAAAAVVHRVRAGTVAGILQKPFDVDELLAAARELIERDRTRGLRIAPRRVIPPDQVASARAIRRRIV